MSSGRKETQMKGYLLAAALVAVVLAFTVAAVWQTYAALTSTGRDTTNLLLPLLWISSIVGWAAVAYGLTTFRRRNVGQPAPGPARHAIAEPKKHRRHHKHRGRRQ